MLFPVVNFLNVVEVVFFSTVAFKIMSFQNVV